jgi:hypothetical protein
VNDEAGVRLTLDPGHGDGKEAARVAVQDDQDGRIAANLGAGVGLLAVALVLISLGS